MTKKIYVAPSNQNANIYSYGGTNEAVQCQAIAGLIPSLLADYDCEVVIGKNNETLQTKADNANKWGADVYLSIHTNAGGGRGTEVWYNPNKSASKDFAQAMYNVIAPISKGGDRGLKKSTSLVDCTLPKMPSCIVEMEFHDWTEGAKWIIENHQQIAQAYVDGLIKYLNIEKKAKEAEVMYYVQTGAFNDKANAERMAAQLKSAGFPVIIKEEKTMIIEQPKEGPVKQPAEQPKPTIQVGSSVKVNKGAKTYTGGSLASFVYTRVHTVEELQGDRAVIMYNGVTVAAVNVKDLTLI